MSNTITSRIIGPLTQEEEFPDWWKSEACPIPFFNNRKLPITFTACEPGEDPSFLPEADEALKAFFSLGTDYRQSISHLVYKNCTDFLNDVGYDDVDEGLSEIVDERDIWRFVHPTEIYVTRRPYRQHDIYVQVACECDWEMEHGLQLVFRQGKKLTRVSSQDGHLTEADAYNIPDEQDELLSKF